MELNKEHWTKQDIKEFCEYEKNFVGEEKECLWEQKIVNTKLFCFGKTASKAKELVKQIKNGNYVEFVDNLKITNHLESLCVAYLICKIKNFDTFIKYLFDFAHTIDNWASCDTLKFDKRNKDQLYYASKKFLQSNKPFVRRVGINMYFELIKDKNFLWKTFEMIDSFADEKDYYVNMCLAWLLCECFCKHRDETLLYFENAKTNTFVINKAISKCRDSFRVSKEDKDLLLTYKK